MGKRRHVHIRVGRGKHRRRLRVATDVIAFDQAIPVGNPLFSKGNIGTTGAMICWDDSGTRRWGLLTDSHVIDATSPNGAVLVRNGTNLDVAGTVVFQTTNRDTCDVAVVEVTAADAAALVPGLDLVNPPKRMVREFAALLNDFENHQDQGTCLRPNRNVDFDTDMILAAPRDWVQGWPNLQNLLRVSAVAGSGHKPFQPGTSGSPWIHHAAGVPMAMLVAAIQPDYNIGVGQALWPLLAFVKGRLNTSDIRLVEVF